MLNCLCFPLAFFHFDRYFRNEKKKRIIQSTLLRKAIMFQPGEFVKNQRNGEPGKVLIREEKYLSTGTPDDWFLLQEKILLSDLHKPWYLVQTAAYLNETVYLPERLLAHISPRVLSDAGKNF